MKVNRKINSEEFKQISIKLLKDFAEFCQNNNLTYYLAYGSLLGAVRHKGLIPWDDDIDVQMPREDYNRLIQLYRESKNNIEFNLFCEELDQSYPHYFAKIGDKSSVLKFQYMKEIKNLGVFIDIFPMDRVYLNNESREVLEADLKKCLKSLELCAMTKCWPAKTLIHTVIKKIFYTYAQMRGLKYWRRKYQNILNKSKQKRESEKPQFVYAWSVLECSVFGTGCLLQYENGLYSCPEKYSDYLTKEYGDYMTPPPLEARHSVHDFEAYYVD